ncbi:MAG: DOMON domain-containing protein [Nitrososphaerales archaeon]
MRRTTKYFFVGVALVISYAVIFFSVSYAINASENQLATLYVPQVNGIPSFQNPGGESFWSGIQATNVPLIDANAYPGTPAGHTDHVSVKMAWSNATGTAELLIRMEFPMYQSVSAISPSMTTPVLNDSTHQTMIPMYNSSCIYPYQSCYGAIYPQDVGFLPLATGTQYVYPEQAIVMLGIAPGANTDAWYAVSYKPKMVLGTSGALGTGSGGAAELWIWSRTPTDNSSSAYPGISLPNGTSLDPSMFGLPSHASYAIDGYTNASSFYQLGGVPPSSQFPFINNAQLYTTNLSSVSLSPSQMINPFEVQAKGQTPSAQTNNDWVVEFVRPLTTSSVNGENQYQLQMNPNSNNNYHIAFAVSQEAASQTYLLYYNSVSFWWNFNFQSNSGFNHYSNQYGAINLNIPIAAALLLVAGTGVLGKRIKLRK